MLSFLNVRSSRPEMSCQRSSHQRCSVKKVFLEISQSEACSFIKKKTLWHRSFPINFATFLRTPFSQNTSGRLLLLLKRCFQDFCKEMKVVFFSVLSSTPAFLSRTVSHKQLPKNTSQPYKICYRKAYVTATGFKSLIKKKK